MNATQFYNATRGPNQPPLLRNAVTDALDLCYEIQGHSSIRKRMELQRDWIWLGMAMNARPLTERVHWCHVRGGTYETGTDPSERLGQWLGEVRNQKPYIVAYTRQTTPPVLLVAFPGVGCFLGDYITLLKIFEAVEILEADVKAQAEGSQDVSGGIKAGGGFADAAQSAVDNGLFDTIEEIIALERKEKGEIQTVFCGHSLGGAVASICAVKYIHEFFGGRNPTGCPVLLITLGQPKTIKKGSEGPFNGIVGVGNYLRLVAEDKEETTTDCITGYREIKDEDEDSFGCCHPVEVYLVNTGITLKNGTRWGRFYKRFSGREWLGRHERLVLHPLFAYERGMEEYPKNPHLLTLREDGAAPPVHEGGPYVTEGRVRTLIIAQVRTSSEGLSGRIETVAAQSRDALATQSRSTQQKIDDLSKQAKEGKAALDALAADLTRMATQRTASPRLGQSLSRISSASPIVFGAAEWERYFGDVGVEPPLPPEIGAILNSRCRIWPEKNVCDTHFLTLIPATVWGRRLTLEYFLELAERPQQGGYRIKHPNLVDPHLANNIPPPQGSSYWVLMTRDAIPHDTVPSPNERLAHSHPQQWNMQWEEWVARMQKDRQNFVEKHVRFGYGMPRALEAIMVLGTQFVRTGDTPGLSVSCQETQSVPNPSAQQVARQRVPTNILIDSTCRGELKISFGYAGQAFDSYTLLRRL